MKTAICTRVGRSGRRTALSLLEMVVVIWGLAILLLIGTALLVGVLRSERVAVLTLDRLTQRSELADQFRNDVAHAIAAPERLDKLVAGPSCLILQMKEDKHIIYRYKDKKLERVESSGSRESRRRLLPSSTGESVKFLRTDGRRLITMRLTPTGDRAERNGPMDISAALGEDR